MAPRECGSSQGPHTAPRRIHGNAGQRRGSRPALPAVIGNRRRNRSPPAAALAGQHQRLDSPHHCMRAGEHVACIGVRHALTRHLVRLPFARRDAFGFLRLGGTRAVGLDLHQEEIAHLMDQPPSKSEPPIDGLDGTDDGQWAEPSLLSDFSHGRRVCALAGLHMPLRKSPVAVAVLNKEKEGPLLVEAGAHHDAASRVLLPARGLRTRWRGGPSRGTASTRAAVHVATPDAVDVPGTPSDARPSMNCRTMGSVVCCISRTVPTCCTRPS